VEARIQGSATRSSASVVAVSGEWEAAAADASAASLDEECGRKKARGPCAPKARRTRREAVAPGVAGWVVGGVGVGFDEPTHRHLVGMARIMKKSTHRHSYIYLLDVDVVQS
jgi:hypothetical protein